MKKGPKAVFFRLLAYLFASLVMFHPAKHSLDSKQMNRQRKMVAVAFIVVQGDWFFPAAQFMIHVFPFGKRDLHVLGSMND